MQVQTKTNNAVEPLVPWRAGLWRFHLPAPRRTGSTEARQAGLPAGSRGLAGVTNRSAGLDVLKQHLRRASGLVSAEQVHGASVAAVDCVEPSAHLVPGCDGLVTQLPGLVLTIQTADCLPLFVWDPIHQVVGLIHAGWRGVARQLPMRLISFLQHRYHSRPHTLWVGIGPAIRACCYEVGPEFEPRFGRFIQTHDGRRTCDLVACTLDQLASAGIRRDRVEDSGVCTACEPARWHSVRREGECGGRLVSFIQLTMSRRGGSA